MNLFATGSAIQLFDYQEEDRDHAVSAFLDRGVAAPLGVWPTGGGKTVLFSELHLHPRMQKWLSQFPVRHRQILVIAHRKELISQAADKIRRSNPDLTVDVEKAERRASPFADVVVASIQTLTANGGKRLRQFNPDRVRIIVIDEAHHAAGPSYHAILQHFGMLPPAEFMAESRPTKKDGRAALLSWQRARLDAWRELYRPKDRLHLGVTATPKRGDNIGLECVYDEIVFERTIREMIERGRLSRIKAFRVKSDTNLDHIKTRAGDLAEDELAEAVNKDPRNAVAVRAYLDYAKGRKGLTFCANIAHSKAMADAFNVAGVPARAVWGTMPDQERAQILKDFSLGKILMLCNCNVLTEGFDEPDVQVIIHARPTKSSLLYIQMTGRGLRLAPNKENCIVIDIVDITKKHSLITSAELLGLPAGFDAKGEDLLDTKRKLEEAQAQNPLVDLTDIKDIDEVELRVAEIDLLGGMTDDTLEKHTELGWVKNGDSYEISWRTSVLNEFLSVSKQPDGVWVAEYKKGREIQWDKEYDTPQEALKSAESWLKSKHRTVASANMKGGRDSKEPATQNQIDFIEGLGMRINPAHLTKGEAKMIINRHWHSKRK